MVVMCFLYFDVFDGHVQSTNTPLSFQCSDPQNRACQMRPRNTCTILEVPLILSPSKVAPSKFSGWLIVFFSYGSMGRFGMVTWSMRINTQTTIRTCVGSCFQLPRIMWGCDHCLLEAGADPSHPKHTWQSWWRTKLLERHTAVLFKNS